MTAGQLPHRYCITKRQTNQGRKRKTERRNEKKKGLTLIVYAALRLFTLVTGVVAAFCGQFYVVFQCFLALCLFFLPTLTERRFCIEWPDTMEILLSLFLFSCLLLGEIFDCYTKIPLWDKVLHLLSGFLTAAVGFSLIDLLHGRRGEVFRLRPLFAALFVFCFSMTSGVVWEFFEYGCDRLFDADMQKDRLIGEIHSALLEEEEILIQSVIVNGNRWEGYLDIGLIDTMEDLLVNAVGAAVFSGLGFFFLKHRGRGGFSFLRAFLLYRAERKDGVKKEGKACWKEKSEKNKFDSRT